MYSRSVSRSVSVPCSPFKYTRCEKIVQVPKPRQISKHAFASDSLNLAATFNNHGDLSQLPDLFNINHPDFYLENSAFDTIKNSIVAKVLDLVKKGCRIEIHWVVRSPPTPELEDALRRRFEISFRPIGNISHFLYVVPFHWPGDKECDDRFVMYLSRHLKDTNGSRCCVSIIGNDFYRSFDPHSPPTFCEGLMWLNGRWTFFQKTLSYRDSRELPFDCHLGVKFNSSLEKRLVEPMMTFTSHYMPRVSPFRVPLPAA